MAAELGPSSSAEGEPQGAWYRYAVSGLRPGAVLVYSAGFKGGTLYRALSSLVVEGSTGSNHVWPFRTRYCVPNFCGLPWLTR